MAEYSNQVGIEEDEPLAVDQVYLSNNVSNSTTSPYPEHYFSANSTDTYDPINQLMIIQCGKTVDGTHPPHCSILPNLQLILQLRKIILMIDLDGHKDLPKDRNTTILLNLN